MRKLTPILFVIGLLLGAIGAAMAAVGVYDFFIGGTEGRIFELSAAITLFCAGALVLANRSAHIAFDHRQAFLLTALAWIACSVFAAIPFFLSDRLDYADAFFETVSALTTTGSTVIAGLDTYPRSLLLWRALMQWLGGAGIIVMALAILPFLRVAGMQLYKAESSDKSEKALPAPGQIARATILVYGALSVLCALAYGAAGMNGFDAATHAMATLATGGFSTYDASFGAFGPAVIWTGTLFMLLAGLPFVLYVRSFSGDPRALHRDAQVRFFLALMVLVSLVLTAYLVMAKDRPVFDALTHAAFNVVSIGTTAGFASENFDAWGPFAQVIFLVLLATGGCSGSTTGGIKMFRIQILALAVRGQILRLVHPHAVAPRIWNGMRVSDEVVGAIAIFLVMYFASVLAIALAVAATGVDLLSAFTGALQAVGNVGPGLGPVIGPAGNFSSLPDTAKVVLAFGMLLGRLELFALLVLLSPRFWRA